MDSVEIRGLLDLVARGDAAAAERVFTRLYDELKRIARAQMRGERRDHTLSPTALVNEAYLKLVASPPDHVEGRRHFFSIAARAMRQVLIDHARRKLASRRGGDAHFVTFDEEHRSTAATAASVIAVHDALDDLERRDPRLAKIVECRFFAGLEQAEIAGLLGISVSTVKRDWRAARAWLRGNLATAN